MAKVKTSNSGRRYVEIDEMIENRLHSKSKVSNETKEAIKGAISEIIAGSVLFPTTDGERLWNNANRRAERILQSYMKGEGLFQLTAKK